MAAAAATAETAGAIIPMLRSDGDEAWIVSGV